MALFENDVEFPEDDYRAQTGEPIFPCPTCDGKGTTVGAPVPCDDCGGWGEDLGSLRASYRKAVEALEHIAESAKHPSPTINSTPYLGHAAREALAELRSDERLL